MHVWRYLLRRNFHFSSSTALQNGVRHGGWDRPVWWGGCTWLDIELFPLQFALTSKYVSLRNNLVLRPQSLCDDLSLQTQSICLFLQSLVSGPFQTPHGSASSDRSGYCQPQSAAPPQIRLRETQMAANTNTRATKPRRRKYTALATCPFTRGSFPCCPTVATVDCGWE